MTGSVHVDPAQGWFPHFLGFAGEAGEGAGAGANRNLPLAPGSGDGPWVAAVEELARWACRRRARWSSRSASTRRRATRRARSR